MDKNKQKYIIWTIIASLFVAFLYVFDFYFQALDPELICDTKYHIEYVQYIFSRGFLPRVPASYPMFFYLIAGLYVLTKDYGIAILIFAGVWSFITNVVQVTFLKSLLNDKKGMYSVFVGTGMSFIWPVSMNAISKLPNFYDYCREMQTVFLTSGTTAPYHNLTSLCVKPFAIITVFLFVQVLSKEKMYTKEVVLMSIMMFLSVLAKPNFYQAFAPAGTVLTIVYFFIRGKESLKRCLSVAISFIPATMWIIYFMQHNLNPVSFDPFVSINLFNSSNIPEIVLIIRAVVFCCFVYAFCLLLRIKLDLIGIVGIVVYVFGLLEWLLLIIPDSPYTLDTVQGLNIGMYLFFLTGIIELKKINADSILRKIYYVIGNTLFWIHALSGMAVFFFSFYGFWKEFIFS